MAATSASPSTAQPPDRCAPLRARIRRPTHTVQTSPKRRPQPGSTRHPCITVRWSELRPNRTSSAPKRITDVAKMFRLRHHQPANSTDSQWLTGIFLAAVVAAIAATGGPTHPATTSGTDLSAPAAAGPAHGVPRCRHYRIGIAAAGGPATRWGLRADADGRVWGAADGVARTAAGLDHRAQTQARPRKHRRRPPTRPSKSRRRRWIACVR